MKFSTTFASLVAYCAIGVHSMPSSPEAASDLTTRNENTLEKRACYRGKKDYGCDKGWCWKRCGGGNGNVGVGGPWCWAKWNWGWGEGNWVSCHSTARRPLLVRPTVLGAIVRAVDAAVEVGNGTSHELTRNTGLGNELLVSQPMRSSLEFPHDSHNNSQCQ
ncbi:hypothetical protein BKA60DRAFT_217798 [Fusarium oxysporum]|nr:hypothetical protein BKA60DRAFT_217798 [Fusarium oxysporum]